MLADDVLDNDNSFLLPIRIDRGNDDGGSGGCCFSCYKQQRSPYLASSIWFALSSIVYAVAAIQMCLKSGFTSENIQSLVAASLYVVAYLSYVRAEWKPIAKQSKADGIAALGSPGALQRY